MHYRNLSETKQGENPMHWQIETSSLNLLQNYEIGYLEYMSASLFAVLYKGVTRLTRWLGIDASTLTYPNTLTGTATSAPQKAKTVLRTNSRGVEIIKRFEHFPVDVEPDVREAERAVRKLVKVPLTSNQFSALVSFTFNVGEATLRQSDLLKYLNAGRYKSAAKQFDCWVYIGSTRFPKLAARRLAERGLFLKAD